MPDLNISRNEELLKFYNTLFKNRRLGPIPEFKDEPKPMAIPKLSLSKGSGLRGYAFTERGKPSPTPWGDLNVSTKGGGLGYSMNLGRGLSMTPNVNIANVTGEIGSEQEFLDPYGNPIPNPFPFSETKPGFGLGLQYRFKQGGFRDRYAEPDDVLGDLPFRKMPTWATSYYDSDEDFYADESDKKRGFFRDYREKVKSGEIEDGYTNYYQKLEGENLKDYKNIDRLYKEASETIGTAAGSDRRYSNTARKYLIDWKLYHEGKGGTEMYENDPRRLSGVRFADKLANLSDEDQEGLAKVGTDIGLAFTDVKSKVDALRKMKNVDLSGLKSYREKMGYTKDELLKEVFNIGGKKLSPYNNKLIRGILAIKDFRGGGFRDQYRQPGYERNSPDVNNPQNVINSGRISMKNVDFPVHGVDNLGNEAIMNPREEYQFPGDEVTETPIRYKRGGSVDWQNLEKNWGDAVAMDTKRDRYQSPEFKGYMLPDVTVTGELGPGKGIVPDWYAKKYPNWEQHYPQGFSSEHDHDASITEATSDPTSAIAQHYKSEGDKGGKIASTAIDEFARDYVVPAAMLAAPIPIGKAGFASNLIRQGLRSRLGQWGTKNLVINPRSMAHSVGLTRTGRGPLNFSKDILKKSWGAGRSAWGKVKSGTRNIGNLLTVGWTPGYARQFQSGISGERSTGENIFNMASATSEFLNPLKWRRGMNRLKAFNDLRRGIFTEEGTSKDLLSGGIRILTGRSKVSSLRQNQALGGLASNVRKTLKYEEDPTTGYFKWPSFFKKSEAPIMPTSRAPVNYLNPPADPINYQKIIDEDLNINPSHVSTPAIPIDPAEDLMW